MRASAVLLHIVLPLVAGAAIYVAWRTPTLLLWPFETAAASSAIATLRTTTRPLRDSLPHWLLFSLPDGLWSYALLSFVVEVWRMSDTRWPRGIWIVIALFIAFGLEAGQAFGVVPGIFDPADLCASACGCLCVSVRVAATRRELK